MRVQELMSAEVHTCTPNDTLERAARLMWDHDCGSAVVVDGAQEPVGVITDRDVCMAAYTQGRRLSELHVASAMSPRLFACRASDSVEKAERMMADRQVRRLPVLDAEGRLVGLLSLNDIARDLARPKAASARAATTDGVARTLSSICQAHHEQPSELMVV
jgi:CBS-domain-containing membrane protein